MHLWGYAFTLSQIPGNSTECLPFLISIPVYASSTIHSDVSEEKKFKNAAQLLMLGLTRLTRLLEINDAFLLLVDDGNVVVVAGMDTIELSVQICEKYMRDNAKKQKKQYSEGLQKTTVTS